MSTYSGWGNGRDALTIWHMIMEERAQRVIHNPEAARSVTEADAQRAMTIMMMSRKRKIKQHHLEQEIRKKFPGRSFIKHGLSFILASDS